MSLQGPLIVVAEKPASRLVAALAGAGAFPIVEARWSDAPTAFVSVKPAGVVIAEPDLPPDESAARMLCLQIATAPGPIVPAIARVDEERDPAIPIALPADADGPLDDLVARLRGAMRVRALHATVLRRLAAADKALALPATDPLDDATVLVAGRGPLYPALTVAMGERVKMIGALSVESAARHVDARDIDGIVVGDGFPARMVEAFLTALTQDARFRDIPVAVAGPVAGIFAEGHVSIDAIGGDPSRLTARMMPRVRLHAFEGRLKRMLTALDAGGHIDAETGLLTPDAFWRELDKVMSEAADRSQPLSVARFAFTGPVDPRSGLDGARLVPRLVRDIDLATRENDGAILVALTQTDLRRGHLVVRRLAAQLKNTMLAPHRAQHKITAHVTLATLKAGDTLDTLMARVAGGAMVAAE